MSVAPVAVVVNFWPISAMVLVYVINHHLRCEEPGRRLEIMNMQYMIIVSG